MEPAGPKALRQGRQGHQYRPLLDARNVSDQGIDATGATITVNDWFVSFPRAVLSIANATKAAAVTAINANVGDTIVAVAGADSSAGVGFATITLTGGTSARFGSTVDKDAVLALNLGAVAKQGHANLYGSSKDVGTITSRLPLLTEDGGRVNRVGFTHVEWGLFCAISGLGDL